MVFVGFGGSLCESGVNDYYFSTTLLNGFEAVGHVGGSHNAAI
jgi:hypothetical protein